MKLLTKFVFVVVISLNSKVVHQLPVVNTPSIEETPTDIKSTTLSSQIESTTQTTTNFNPSSTPTPNPTSNATVTTYQQLLTRLRKFFMTQFDEKYFSFFKWNWEALRDHSRKFDRVHYQFRYRETLDYDDLLKKHTTPFSIPPEYTRIYIGISEFDRRYSVHRHKHPEEYTDVTFPDITLNPFNPDESWPMLNENDTFLNSKGEQWDVV